MAEARTAGTQAPGTGDWLPDATALAGAWRIRRRIEDARAGLTGTLEGETLWTPVADGLLQSESGVLRYGDAAPMQASRRYLWLRDGAGWDIRFEDGRPFHRLAPGRIGDRHHCDPDIYDVTYDFGLWPAWHSVWHVAGPRKKLRIETAYRRGDQSGIPAF